MEVLAEARRVEALALVTLVGRGATAGGGSIPSGSPQRPRPGSPPRARLSTSPPRGRPPSPRPVPSPPYRVLTTPLPRGSLSWCAFSRRRALANHQRIHSLPLRSALHEWGERLARVSLASGWTPVFLTLLWPEAPTPAASYASCGELRTALEGALGPLGVVYAQTSLEVLRFREDKAAIHDGFDALEGEDSTVQDSDSDSGAEGTPPPSPPSSPQKGRKGQKGRKKKATALRLETRRKEALTRSSNLDGHGHLHALLLLPPAGLEGLEELLWPWGASLDANSTIVGGTRPLSAERVRLASSPTATPEPTAVKTLGGHLTRVLSYLAKEGTLEETERLGDQLAQGGIPSLGSKFTLTLSPSLATLGGYGTALGPLPRLTSGLPSLRLSVLSGEILTFPPYLSGNIARLTWLVTAFLSATGHRLLYHNTGSTKDAAPYYWMALVRGALLRHSGALQVVARGPEGLQDALYAWCSVQAPHLLDFVDSRREPLIRLLESGKLPLPSTLLLTKPYGTYLTLADGVTLSWGSDRLLVHAADEFATMVRPLRGPYGRYTFSLTSATLLERATSGEALCQLRRLLHRPTLSPQENHERLVVFLQHAGRLLRSPVRNELGILLSGRGGSGKTLLANALLATFGRVGSLTLASRRGDFWLQLLQRCAAIKVDDVTEGQDPTALFDVMSPNRREVNRKGVIATTEDFSNRPVVLCSNRSPSRLLGSTDFG